MQKWITRVLKKSNEFKEEKRLSTASAAQQVDDDTNLLELMIVDQENAAPIYHSAARWKKYSANLIRFIRANGLTDFRRVQDRDEEGARDFDLSVLLICN